MTPEDRVRAIAEFGFTPRQARFLVLVLRHSGVCLPRQYATLAGIVHGEKTRAFFSKLVNCGYASAYPCRHNRAKLYDTCPDQGGNPANGVPERVPNRCHARVVLMNQKLVQHRDRRGTRRTRVWRVDKGRRTAA